jgi:hypothetical protein
MVVSKKCQTMEGRISEYLDAEGIFAIFIENLLQEEVRSLSP